MLCCLIDSASQMMFIIKALTSKTRPIKHLAQMSQPHPYLNQPSADHQVSRNGALLGIHDEIELRRLLAAGHYSSADFYWKAGMASWAPLSTLPSEATGAPAATLPPPLPTQRIAIRGTVTTFNIQNGSGMISGLNGVRYNFVSSNWGSPTVAPTTGQLVEFEANGADALQIFPVHGSSGLGSGDFYRSNDNAIVSGVCAGLAHKWNTDPVLIRIAMVFIPFGWIFYIIGSMSWSARPTR